MQKREETLFMSKVHLSGFVLPTGITFILLLLAWSIYLTIVQWRLSNEVSKLREDQNKLLHLEMKSVEIADKTWSEERLIKKRIKRETDVQPEIQSRKQMKERKRKNKNKIRGVHFVPDVNQDRMLRQIAEGRTPEIGNLTEHGLRMKGHIFNFWKPEPWSNHKMFQYNASTGKVKVTSPGLYLIYGQVMFYSPRSRKSYGIHINDETYPFVEALSFQLQHPSRRRRDLDATNAYFDDVTSKRTGMRNLNWLNYHTRHKRNTYALYSQCNTMAVAYLHRKDEVFLKSLEPSATIIYKPYLTFWGLVRI